MLRRKFIQGLLAGLGLAAIAEKFAMAAGAPAYTFAHGVASGDPLADGFIIWTRVSGGTGADLGINWAVARDRRMRRIVASGTSNTGPQRDYTVKVDVRGLKPGRKYYYRFSLGKASSATGRSRTLPARRLRKAEFAVVSCSNYAAGYFHAYREIAGRDDIDAVIHLGDYIYEYGMGAYATEDAEALGRVPEPRSELLTLADYRQRHAQYKSDRDSQAMHARHPMIVIWDDHELSNDAWQSGAQNHQPDEGGYAARVTAAVQAYFEWMPIRGEAKGTGTAIFRSFQYGDLLSLIMLDTRLYGRDQQADAVEPGKPLTLETITRKLQDPARELLGCEQQQWLRQQLSDSAARWQVLGQQVLVAPLYSPDLAPLLDVEQRTGAARQRLEGIIARSKSNPPMLLDTWDGYPHARQRLLRDLAEHAKNPLLLSGDLHTALATELIPAGNTEPAAVEFVTNSVSSPGITDFLPEKTPGTLRQETLQLNPWLRHMETEHRGWMQLELTHRKCTVKWHEIDTVKRPGYRASLGRQMSVRAGEVSKGLHLDA